MLINVNHIEMYIEEHGQGRPLVMVHGNGEDHRIFNEAVKELSPYYRVITADSRGHGQSSEIRKYHYDDMARDYLELLEKLELEDVIFYGFSDGGIIGLLLAMKTDRITDLIISGANLNPLGLVPDSVFRMVIASKLLKDPKIELMKNEPDIRPEKLSRIKARTLVLAGEHDLIRYAHTKKIADAIPGSRLRIIKGESHGSYVVHSTKIATIILKWMKQKG